MVFCFLKQQTILIMYKKKAAFLKISLLSLIMLYGFCTAATAQEDNMPVVSVLGTNEEAYDALFATYNHSLFGVCNDDLDSTYRAWEGLLLDMERYAEEINFDLKGIHLRLSVFCQVDGAINHLTFSLLPSSRNIALAELTAFFKQFVQHSKWTINANKAFYHDGQAGFPVRPERYKD